MICIVSIQLQPTLKHWRCGGNSIPSAEYSTKAKLKYKCSAFVRQPPYRQCNVSGWQISRYAVVGFNCRTCFVKLDNVTSPPLAIIAPPTNGKPAPTKSAILLENKNGKQNSIPNVPSTIAM